MLVGDGGINVVKERSREVRVRSTIDRGARRSGGAEEMRADIDTCGGQRGRFDRPLNAGIGHRRAVV